MEIEWRWGFIDARCVVFGHRGGRVTESETVLSVKRTVRQSGYLPSNHAYHAEPHDGPQAPLRTRGGREGGHAGDTTIDVLGLAIHSAGLGFLRAY